MKRLRGGRYIFNLCVVFPQKEKKKTVLVPFFWAKQFHLSADRLLINCSHLTAEESDSDSDEDLEGGVRHDLMMADEKVQCTWWCKNHLFLLSKQNSTEECARQWLNKVEWQNSPAHVINNLALAIGLQKTSLLCHRNIPYLTTVIPMCPTPYVTGIYWTLWGRVLFVRGQYFCQSEASRSN